MINMMRMLDGGNWKKAQRGLRRGIADARRAHVGAGKPPDAPVPAPTPPQRERRRRWRRDLGRWLVAPTVPQHNAFNAVLEQLERQKRELDALRATLAEGTSRSDVVVADALARRYNAFDYLAFENTFRGSEEFIAGRQREYLDYFQGVGQVLDIGSGRGEFLAMLRERGTLARGVDLSAEMVEHARARGLEVVQADAATYLEAQPEGSLGGVFMSQVVEHLTTEELTTLLRQIGRVCAPDAVLIAETLNPESWPVLSRWYWLDPSHVRLVHPETLQFHFDQAGFEVKTVQKRNAVPLDQYDSPQSEAVPESDDALAQLTRRVEAMQQALFGMTDYFVLGQRRA